MNLRHTAALALVGWYLMLLPKGGHTLQVFDIPWTATQRSFDTAKECEDARAKAVVPPDTAVSDSIKRLTGQPQSSPVAATADDRAFFCIETGDPRLKADRTN